MIYFELVTKTYCDQPGKRQTIEFEAESYRDLASIISAYMKPFFLGNPKNRVRLVMWSYQPGREVILRIWEAKATDESGAFNPHWAVVQ